MDRPGRQALAGLLVLVGCGGGVQQSSEAVVLTNDHAAPVAVVDTPEAPVSVMCGIWTMSIAGFCGADVLKVTTCRFDDALAGWHLDGWWRCHDATTEYSGFFTGFHDSETATVTLVFDRAAGTAIFAAPTDGTAAGLITRPDGSQVAFELTMN